MSRPAFKIQAANSRLIFLSGEQLRAGKGGNVWIRLRCSSCCAAHAVSSDSSTVSACICAARPVHVLHGGPAMKNVP